MADVTVTQFAQVLRVPVDRLLSQLGEAGVDVTGADDTISDDAKLELLTHLRPCPRAKGCERLHAPQDHSETQVAERKSGFQADRAVREP